MAKDSQIDDKQTRKQKSKNKITFATENNNKNPNAKKQSIKNGDV